jgi:hypothetical protein
MKLPVVATMLLLASTATSQSQQPIPFASDRPTPLRQIDPKRPHTVSRFTGSVQLAGRFLVTWVMVDGRPRRLQAIFYPNEESTALLPRMQGDRPVEGLYLSNADDASAMLLDEATVQSIRSKEQLSVQGRATVTIRAYTVEVACDQRWYSAELVSAVKSQELVTDARSLGRFGCG